MKKLMAPLLSMVMVLSLAACGGAASSSAAPAESVKTEEDTAAPSSAPAAPAADSAEEGSTNEGNATAAETVGDPFEAMAEDWQRLMRTALSLTSTTTWTTTCPTTWQFVTAWTRRP